MAARIVIYRYSVKTNYSAHYIQDFLQKYEKFGESAKKRGRTRWYAPVFMFCNDLRYNHQPGFCGRVRPLAL